MAPTIQLFPKYHTDVIGITGIVRTESGRAFGPAYSQFTSSHVSSTADSGAMNTNPPLDPYILGNGIKHAQILRCVETLPHRLPH